MTRIRTNGSRMIEVNKFWRTKMCSFVVVVEIVIFCRNRQNIEFFSVNFKNAFQTTDGPTDGQTD